MTNNQDYDQLSVTIEKLLDKFVGSQVIRNIALECVWRKEFFAVVDALHKNCERPPTGVGGSLLTAYPSLTRTEEIPPTVVGGCFHFSARKQRLELNHPPTTVVGICTVRRFM